MPLSLEKGDSLTLEKGLDKVTFGVGWNVPDETLLKAEGKPAYDLDLVAIQINENETSANVTYFNKKNGMLLMDSTKGKFCHSKAVRLDRDNLTGAGSGDDEQLWIDFSKVPEDVIFVDIWIAIYKATERKQHLGEIDGAEARVFRGIEMKEPASTNDILATIKISARMKFNGMTAIQAVRFFKGENGWQMKNIEKADMGGLEGIWKLYNLNDLHDEEPSRKGETGYPIL